MGWTGLYDKPHSIPEYFKQEWEAGGKLRCLGQAFVGRFVLYGVWEKQVDGLFIQFATVTLIQYGKTNDSCRWYYKDMDETVGPNECSMPMTLLRKLKTPAYNEWARAWRKACWKNALGLTRRSRLIQIRRAWKRNTKKAYDLADDWNKKNPFDKINLSGSYR